MIPQNIPPAGGMGHPFMAPYGTEKAAYATCFYYRGLVPVTYTMAAELSTVMLSVYDNESQGMTIKLDGRGADMAQISDDDAERISSWDARAWHVQKSLLSILLHRAGVTKDAPRRDICYNQNLLQVSRPNLHDELANFGHVIIRNGKITQYMRCGQKWQPGDRINILAQGPCKGKLFSDTRGPDPDMPLPVPTQSNIVYGKALHPSHILNYYTGLLFCSKCGCRTTSARVEDLAALCRMKPSTPATAYQLTRIKRGLHPRGSTLPFPTTRLARPESLKAFVQTM